MSKSPQVSIVMCTYNGSRFIDEQLQSILAQDFSDFELIIVDDRSTDDTYDKLLAWRDRSDRVSVYRNEQNLGYNENFSRAIARAAGNFVSIADQDDIWMPDKTRLLYEAFDDPAVILAHSVSIRLEGASLNHRKRRLQYHFSGNDTRKLLMFNGIMGHDMMFRRGLLKHVLPIPQRMSYDWWIAVVASTLGRISSVPQAIVHHRIHENNSFFKKTEAARRREMDLDEVWENFLRIPTLSPDHRRFLEKSLSLVRKQVEDDTNFNPALFNHLFSNRKIFFGHKRRMFPVFSHFKNSVRYAKLNFRNKGTI